VSCLANFSRTTEAREYPGLFPAFRGLVSAHEYAALGQDFEKQEQNLAGESGFEHMVEKVATLEKGLGIFDLAKFTPP